MKALCQALAMHLYSQCYVSLSRNSRWAVWFSNGTTLLLIFTFLRSRSRQSFSSASRHLDMEEQKHVSDVIIWSPACDRPAAQPGVCSRTALITKQNKTNRSQIKMVLTLLGTQQTQAVSREISPAETKFFLPLSCTIGHVAAPLA